MSQQLFLLHLSGPSSTVDKSTVFPPLQAVIPDLISAETEGDSPANGALDTPTEDDRDSHADLVSSCCASISSGLDVYVTNVRIFPSAPPNRCGGQ